MRVLPYVGITPDHLHDFTISQMEGLHVHLTFVFLPFGMHLFKESNLTIFWQQDHFTKGSLQWGLANKHQKIEIKLYPMTIREDKGRALKN